MSGTGMFPSPVFSHRFSAPLTWNCKRANRYTMHGFRVATIVMLSASENKYSNYTIKKYVMYVSRPCWNAGKVAAFQHGHYFRISRWKPLAWFSLLRVMVAQKNKPDVDLVRMNLQTQISSVNVRTGYLLWRFLKGRRCCLVNDLGLWNLKDMWLLKFRLFKINVKPGRKIWWRPLRGSICFRDCFSMV